MSAFANLGQPRTLGDASGRCDEQLSRGVEYGVTLPISHVDVVNVRLNGRDVDGVNRFYC